MSEVTDRLDRESFLHSQLAVWLDPRRWDDLEPGQNFWEKDREPLTLEVLERKTKIKSNRAKFNNYENFNGHPETELEQSRRWLNIKNFPDLWVVTMLEKSRRDPDMVFAVPWEFLNMPYDMDSWSHITYDNVLFYSPVTDYVGKLKYLRRAMHQTWEFALDEARQWGKVHTFDRHMKGNSNAP